MSDLKFRFDVESCWENIPCNGNYFLLRETAYYTSGVYALRIQEGKMIEVLNDVPVPRPSSDRFRLRDLMIENMEKGVVYRVLFHNGLDLIVNSWEHLLDVLGVTEEQLIDQIHQKESEMYV